MIEFIMKYNFFCFINFYLTFSLVNGSRRFFFALIENEKINHKRVVEINSRAPGDALFCCAICAKYTNCFSVAVSKTSAKCALLFESLCPSRDLIYSNEWDVYREEWTLVFRGTAGINVPLVDTWTGKTAATNPAECNSLTSTTCRAHYRHDVIDEWACLNAKEVMVSLQKGMYRVASVVFDAKGSDNRSWFSPERISTSTWPDLSQDDNFDNFTLTGDGQGRSFHIGTNSVCGDDVGFMMAVDTTMTNVAACSFENMTSYPQFLYSQYREKVTWESQAFGKADVLAVLVRSSGALSKKTMIQTPEKNPVSETKGLVSKTKG